MGGDVEEIKKEEKRKRGKEKKRKRGKKKKSRR